MWGVNIYKDDKSINDCDDGIWILFDYEFTLYLIMAWIKLTIGS